MHKNQTHRCQSRRKFLRGSVLGTGFALGLGASVPISLQRAALASNLAGDSQDNVLVVIQLSGGNDGLNTVIPVHDDAYYAARPKLAIPKNETIELDEELALHPSLRGFANLIEAGQGSVIHGVGYERPNRSHFESMDVWHTCLRKGQTRKQGWLGRYLDETASQSGGDLPAIHFGGKKQPLALAANNVRVPSVSSVDEFRLKNSRADELAELIQNLSDSTGSAKEENDLLSFVQTNTTSALAASERVNSARSSYKSKTKYPESALAEKLSVIAQLLDAKLATRVYYVELDGFDTHAQQPNSHASLLREWSEALHAFVSDLDEHGHLSRVSVLTFSEFGRRVAENASLGTDHGAAAPVFLAGADLPKASVGKQPSLTDLEDGDLKYNIDFRTIYASILNQRLGVQDTRKLVGEVEQLELFG